MPGYVLLRDEDGLRLSAGSKAMNSEDSDGEIASTFSNLLFGCLVSIYAICCDNFWNNSRYDT